MLPTHEVYRVLIKIGRLEWLWTFRLHDDDTLLIAIERDGDSRTGQELTTAYSIRDFDQHVDWTYIAGNQVLKRNTPSRGTHTCEFLLAQRVDSHPRAYFLIQKVPCVLSPTLGFQCKVDFGEIHTVTLAYRTFTGLDRALQRPLAWTVAEEPVRATLRPLSCGFYTLKGGLMCNGTGFYSPIIMHVELLPGGQVGGTGFDSGFHFKPKTVPLTGTWTADSLEISQRFATSPPHDERRILHLRGRVRQYEFQAQWEDDIRPFRSQVHYILIANLRVTSMRRRWSPQEHSLFPDAFREAVRWCLLSSLRRRHFDDLWMPNVLWLDVFRFCDSQWFVGR